MVNESEATVSDPLKKSERCRKSLTNKTLRWCPSYRQFLSIRFCPKSSGTSAGKNEKYQCGTSETDKSANFLWDLFFSLTGSKSSHNIPLVQTDGGRQTTDDRWSEKLTWAFSSGELMKERVSKLTYPTLQHCLRMLYTINGNSKH